MAATLTDKRFSDPAWTFERKLDGIRVLAYKNGAKVELWSRNRLPLTANYPAVAEAIAKLPVETLILDGEAAWAWGRLGKADYHVFDVLFLDGARPARRCRSSERRKLLRGLKLQHAARRWCPSSTATRPGSTPARDGWEGVIAKRRDSPYESRRSPHWLKMKCEATQELVIGGFTDPQGARVGLGALLVGYFEKDDFVFAGKVGTGFDTKLLNEPARAARRADGAEAAVHQGHRPAEAARALGEAGDRRAGGLHRMDAVRQAAASAAARPASRQGRARRGQGDARDRGGRQGSTITTPTRCCFRTTASPRASSPRTTTRWPT